LIYLPVMFDPARPLKHKSHHGLSAGVGSVL
jgi:hypothetical protein